MNHKVLLKACIAALAILTGCTADNHNKYIIKTGDIYIVAGAVTGTTTKVAYEYDQKESIHRTVWSENEELYVAAYADGSRVNADGTSWSLFSTLTTDEGFNKEYMLFTGSALTPSTPEIASEQKLYALYPASALCDAEHDTVVLPAKQKYSSETFDTSALVMVSAPLTVTLPSEGTVYTSAFRFRHYTGYLKLSFTQLPDEVAEERISKITLQSSENKPLSGKYSAIIDTKIGDWSFEASTETSNSIELDFSNENITVGELTNCWFVMMPGKYGDVTITIHTVNHSTISMQRSGLAIESNVIHAHNISYNTSSDQIKYPVTITINGNDLNFPKRINMETITGQKDGVDFSHKSVIYKDLNGTRHFELQVSSSDDGGSVWNTSEFPAPLVSVEICFADTNDDRFVSKFVLAQIGTSLNDYQTECYGTGDTILTIYPPDGYDCRYFCIKNTNTSDVVKIKQIKFTCAPN